MTASRTWKKLEQYWAELHGESRSGPTGRDQPDVTMEHSLVGIECKLQTRRTLRTTDIEQARDNALKHGRPWILVLHEKGSEYREDLVVMDHDTYLLLRRGLLDTMHGDAHQSALTVRAMNRYPTIFPGVYL